MLKFMFIFGLVSWSILAKEAKEEFLKKTIYKNVDPRTESRLTNINALEGRSIKKFWQWKTTQKLNWKNVFNALGVI